MVPQLEATRLADPLDRPPATAGRLDLHVPVARHQALSAGVQDGVRAADAACDADGAGGQVTHGKELGQAHLPRPGQAASDGLLGTRTPDGDQSAGGGQHGQQQETGGQEGRHRARDYGPISRR